MRQNRDESAAANLTNMLFDPANSTLAEVGQMVNQRHNCDYPIANLGDGTVLVSGGHSASANDFRAAEIFE